MFGSGEVWKCKYLNLRPGNYSFKLEWMDKSGDFCEENEDDQVVIECFCEKRTV